MKERGIKRGARRNGKPKDGVVLQKTATNIIAIWPAHVGLRKIRQCLAKYFPDLQIIRNGVHAHCVYDQIGWMVHAAKRSGMKPSWTSTTALPLSITYTDGN